MILPLVVFSQDKLSDKIYFGGGGGFSANSNQTNISIFPQVGYKITDRYSAGLGFTYQYVKVKQPSFSLSNYGWSIFNRYNITRQFFAFGEYERLNFEYPISAELTERNTFNSLLLGGGYSEQIAGRASFNVTVLYNVLYDEAEFPKPYNSPWVIRAGVGIGIF
jgi:hypothetical protein